MLTVKLYNGDESTERRFYIYNISDFKVLEATLLEELQKIEENNKNEDKIALQRIFDNSDYDNEDDLIEWIERMQEMESDLRNSDYDDIDEMTDRIQTLEEAIDNICHEADDVRRW